MRLGGELTGAAAEIGDAGACDVALDQREQVEERLRSLGAEPVVLLRVPGVGHRFAPNADAAAALRRGA